MCNKLHLGYEKIAPEGKAYKLVRRVGWPLQKWKGLLIGCSTYNVSTDGWIRWKDCFGPKGSPIYGFCFIPTLKEAIKVREQWRNATGTNSTIVEVDYKQGLGRFVERFFMQERKINIMLAREFKIIREVKPW